MTSCAVACILRLSPDDNKSHELLFARRTVNPRDRHSGEVCFPGGKVDPNEDELNCAHREVYEEIGLDISNRDQYKYLGKITDSAFVYYRNSKKTVVSTMVFLAN